MSNWKKRAAWAATAIVPFGAALFFCVVNFQPPDRRHPPAYYVTPDGRHVPLTELTDQELDDAIDRLSSKR